MAVAFVRQISTQPGIQLNPLADGSDGFAPDNADQIFAIAMRAKRGRIDRPFKVNRGNFNTKLGTESIRASLLNEAGVQVFEALNSGAFEAVVHRLVSDDAELSYVVAVAADTGSSGAPVYDGNITYTVTDTLPTEFLFALTHNECFNDGIIVEAHADANIVGGTPVAATVITIRVRDASGNLLFDFGGSLDETAVDESGRSLYLPDVLESIQTTNDLEIVVSPGHSIGVASNAYGRASNGLDKVAVSDVQFYFDEGSSSYSSANYITARERLTNTEFDFAYIASGGSRAAGLLVQLSQLAFDTNKQLRFDVPGELSPDAAIAFVNQLGIDSHYCAAFWAPIRCDDPINGGKASIGTSAFHIAKACLRNAATNSQGFAPKNRAIGGKAYPLTRSGMKQTYDPTQFELSDLAAAKINPVLFQRYNGGGSYVFTDVLTMAKTEVSYRKLIPVADMSSSIDETVTRFGKEVLLLPMQTAIARMEQFLQTLFDGAEAAGWLVPTPELDGASYRYIVAANSQRPADRMDVSYGVRYDGTVRQIFVQQTITR